MRDGKKEQKKRKTGKKRNSHDVVSFCACVPWKRRHRKHRGTGFLRINSLLGLPDFIGDVSRTAVCVCGANG